MQLYLAVVSNRRRNNGNLSPQTSLAATAAVRNFLAFLGVEPTATSLSELITRTK